MAVKDEKKIGIGILLLLALLLLAWRKKQVVAAPEVVAPPQVVPLPIPGKPKIRVLGLGWEGSPQTATITKQPGDYFTAVIDIDNLGAPGELLFKLGIGNRDIVGAFDELAGSGSPWSRALTCPPGRSKVYMRNLLLLSTARRQATPYDAYVLVQGRAFHSTDCFTIPLAAAPAIQVFGLAWL